MVQSLALEPSQVLQEAWQARQVPDPRYIPGMHSLVVEVMMTVVMRLVLRVHLAWGGRHWSPAGSQPSLHLSQTPLEQARVTTTHITIWCRLLPHLEPLHESQPAGQGRHSLRPSWLK